jgi:hypothetical protein
MAIRKRERAAQKVVTIGIRHRLWESDWLNRAPGEFYLMGRGHSIGGDGSDERVHVSICKGSVSPSWWRTSTNKGSARQRRCIQSPNSVCRSIVLPPGQLCAHLPSNGVTGAHDGESIISPAAILKQVTPPDDAGAATFDRYEWQAVMATADILAAYLEELDGHGNPSQDSSFEMICEHHEDWALSDGSAAEIISAKHRETSVGAITTIRKLLVDGGVLHLFDRWLALGRTPSCRLVTTGGLANDARSVMEVAQAFADGTPDGPDSDAIMTKVVAAVAHARGMHVNEAGEADHDIGPDEAGETTGDRETLAGFLGMLRIEHSRPSREHVTLMAPGAYAQPVADKLSVPSAADAIWSAVLGLVRERMRAAGPRRRGLLPTVLGARNEPGYETRTITLFDVTVAVGVAIENQSGFGSLPRRIRTSRVAIKMATGGCSDNTVERAEELRRQYLQYWREVEATPSVDPVQRRVENDLLRVIDEATEVVRLDGQGWGSALWRELQARLDDAVAENRSHGLDADLLLGGISELTNGCKAWFSDAFDVDAEAHSLMPAATGTAGHAGAASGSGQSLETAAEPSESSA